VEERAPAHLAQKLPLLKIPYVIHFFMKKSLLVLASLLLFSLFFIMLEEESNTKLDIHLKGGSFFEGLKIVQKKNGVENWILTAKRADISKDGDLANLTDLEMEVKDKEITIYAEKGLYNLDTKKISIEGTITARNNNYSITSGEVEIDSAAGSLTTNEDVTIDGEKFHLQGKGMEIKNNEQKVRILKDVKATFHN
jgi:LPS export ABC transporter protein LptC